MSIETWLKTTCGDDSRHMIALRAGIYPATFNRQLQQGCLTPANVVKIARAYRVSVLDGLVALGLLTQEEAHSPMPASASVSTSTQASLIDTKVSTFKQDSSAPSAQAEELYKATADPPPSSHHFWPLMSDRALINELIRRIPRDGNQIFYNHDQVEEEIAERVQVETASTRSAQRRRTKQAKDAAERMLHRRIHTLHTHSSDDVSH